MFRMFILISVAKLHSNLHGDQQDDRTKLYKIVALGSQKSQILIPFGLF